MPARHITTEQDCSAYLANLRKGSKTHKEVPTRPDRPKNGPKPVDKAPMLKKRNKYNARKVEYDGYVFDSTVEYERYKELRLLEKGGKIQQIVVHPEFTLVVQGQKVGTYTADSSYWEATYSVPMWEWVVEDVKSEFTRKNREYRRNLKLMLAIHGITIREIVR